MVLAKNKSIAQAPHGPGPCSVLSCFSAQELVSIYSAAGIAQDESAHERENEEQRMEKELHLQAQPEINELSAPVPRPATMTGS